MDQFTEVRWISLTINREYVVKVLLITNIPNPYRIPLFNLLNEELKASGHSLYVLFAVRDYNRRKFELNMDTCRFDYHFLGSHGFRLGLSEGLMFTYPGILRHVIKNRPDQIIVSGFSLATVKLFLFAGLYRISYIIWSGAVLREGRFDSFLRLKMRRLMVRMAKGFIAYGSKAREYLLYLGADGSNIRIGINTVDTSFFESKTAEIRRHIDATKVPVLTYIGYLTGRKNVACLLELAQQLKKQHDFKLVIVGDGEQRIMLEEQTGVLGLNDRVEFAGFRQPEELPAFLAQTDIFLFQTSFDIWGLTLNEAMAAGCCCVASINAGATSDLIQEGVTGYIADFNATDKTVDLVHKLLENAALREETGSNASRFIREKVSLQQSVNGFLQALTL